MALQHMGSGSGPGSIFRTDSMGSGQIFRSDSMGYTDMEKRQLFLRSYQFCRKKTVSEKIKSSFIRVKRVIWVRLRSAKKIRKMVWFRIRHGLFYSTKRRRWFLRLHNHNNYCYRSSSYSCLW